MGNQYIYMNGEFVEKKRQLFQYMIMVLYGDGVFEGFVVTVEMYFV